MKRLAILGAAMLALTARPAFATSITVTGNTTFNVSWLNTVTNPDLSGSARFTISNFTAGEFDLLVDQIMNTTPTSPSINARLTSFGFGLDPDFTSYSNAVNGSVFSWGFSNFPGYSVDACGYAGNNCAGGGNDGLGQGQSMAGGMSIHFNGPFWNGVTFSPVVARFQTSLGSYEFDSTITTNDNTTTDVSAVPEPASLVLFGSGLLIAAARLKRARRTRS